MLDKDINLVLKKADELKALFVLGQRVIPFLEEIFLFVNEIKPILDEINLSIEENLEKMPSASKQLSKVTEATELATNEIMDIVDGLFYKSEVITGNLKKIYDNFSNPSNDPVRILEMLYKAIDQGKDLKAILPQLKGTIASMKKSRGEEMEKIYNETGEVLQSIGMDSSQIMMSLQVQDITSQQIAAVNKLLETIQTKLGSILSHFQKSDLSDLVKQQDPDFDERTNVSELHRKIAFDPEAVDSLDVKDSRQGEVDRLMKQHEEGTLQNEDDPIQDRPASNPSDISEQEVPDPIDEIVEEIGADTNEEISDDDIDALFASAPDEQTDATPDANEQEISEPVVENNQEESVAEDNENMNEEFSQDDIDALFSGNS